MAGEQISKYLGNKIIRWLSNAADMPARPASLYLALFDGNPHAAGTEVTTTVRVAGRVLIDLETPPAAGTDNDIASDADVDFGVSAGAADVDYAAIFDAASSGNLLLGFAITPQSIVPGANVKVPSTQLTIRIGEA